MTYGISRHPSKRLVLRARIRMLTATIYHNIHIPASKLIYHANRNDYTGNKLHQRYDDARTRLMEQAGL